MAFERVAFDFPQAFEASPRVNAKGFPIVQFQRFFNAYGKRFKAPLRARSRMEAKRYNKRFCSPCAPSVLGHRDPLFFRRAIGLEAKRDASAESVTGQPIQFLPI